MICPQIGGHFAAGNDHRVTIWRSARLSLEAAAHKIIRHFPLAPIVRNVGLLLLVPFAISLVRYAAFPYASSPGPSLAFLILYGGYITLAGYVISFVTIGYLLSKQSVGTAVRSGAFCATAYFILQFVIASIIWWLLSGTSVLASIDLAAIARAAAYLVGAFGLGASGFLIHARSSPAAPKL